MKKRRTLPVLAIIACAVLFVYIAGSYLKVEYYTYKYVAQVANKYKEIGWIDEEDL